MKRFDVLIGCNYTNAAGEGVRREIGDVIDDLTPRAEAALLDAGAIARVAEEAALEHSVPAYHAMDGKVYHTRADCKDGNNIEPGTRIEGIGGLKQCRHCSRLERDEKE